MPGGGATGASAAGVTLTGIRSGAWLASFMIVACYSELPHRIVSDTSRKSEARLDISSDSWTQ
jgi:hypothetical protein